MNKQEAIKKAWGDNYPADGVDENGWSKKEFKYGEYNVSHFDAQMYLCGANIRPKELSGIENNNGWIKIDETNDCFQLGIDCHFILKSGVQGIFIDLDNSEYLTLKNRATHYKIIEKPKPPIY